MPRRTQRDLSAVSVSDIHPLSGDEAVLPSQGPGGGPLDGGLVLGQGFYAQIIDPAIGVQVKIGVVAHERRLACSEVHVEGLPVTGTVLRSLPLDAYVALAREALGPLSYITPAPVVTQVGDRQMMQWRGSSRGERAKLAQAQDGHHRGPDRLPEVVAAYRQAMAEGAHDPTATAARRLHYSRGHVSKLLSKARKPERALLGPARGRGRSGEVSVPAISPREGGEPVIPMGNSGQGQRGG